MRQLAIFTTPADADVELRHDAGPVFYGVPGTVDNRPAHLIAIDGVPDSNGARLVITREGFVPVEQRGVLVLTRSGPFAEFHVDDVHLVPSQTRRPFPPESGRLRVVHARLVRQDGSHFVWQGATAFRLVELVAAGQQEAVEAYCAWAAEHDITILRVLTMAGSHSGNGVPYLFRLEPDRGRAALSELLTIAASYGLYAEVVCFADTRFFDFDHRQHATKIGRILAEHPNAVGQIANEPEHGTQRGELADPRYLEMLRACIPADVPTTLGAAHGSNDFEFKWAGGDFVTVHLDRADGEDHFTHDGAGLRWVRHIKDALDTSDTLRKYVVNDEPRRNDLTPWKHTAVALICRMLGVGDTFHYGGGLGGKIPDGAELAAFEGRRRGWQAIPAAFNGRFYNTGHAGSPVTNADWSTVLKVFSAVEGSSGYTLAIGSSSPRFTWASEWPNRELILQDGGTLLWKVSR